MNRPEANTDWRARETAPKWDHTEVFRPKAECKRQNDMYRFHAIAAWCQSFRWFRRIHA